MSNEHKIFDSLMNGATLTVQKCLLCFSTTELRMYVSRIKKKGYHVSSEMRDDVVTDQKWKEYYMTDRDKAHNFGLIKNRRGYTWKQSKTA